MIVVGDAEQPLPALLELWHSGARGQAFLELAAAVPGVYVPSVHDPARERVRLSVSDDIGASLRDEISVSLDGTRRIEIARGCTEGCRFCQAGMIYRPVRERDPEAIVDALVGAIQKGGYDEASLTSLSTADYSAIAPLVQQTKVWNRVALHHLAYRQLREQFPEMGSQMVCNAIYSVSRTGRLVFQHPPKPVQSGAAGGQAFAAAAVC